MSARPVRTGGHPKPCHFATTLSRWAEPPNFYGELSNFPPPPNKRFVLFVPRLWFGSFTVVVSFLGWAPPPMVGGDGHGSVN